MAFNPTPQQQTIIDCIAQQPDQCLNVDARAGSAKTSTIEIAAKHILPSYSTAAVAFNKRIAEELTSRLPSHITCMTLNGAGHRAWGKRLGKRLQVNADKLYQLLKGVIGDRKDDDDMFAAVLALTRRAKSAGLVPLGAPMGVQGLMNDSRESWENFAFELGMDLDDEMLFFSRQLLLKSISTAFQTEIDFDDQIYMSVLFGGVYERYHTVIVDEAQDLSPLNHRQLLSLTATRLIAVGDPYQAIYAFRGADSNSMTNLIYEWETKNPTKPFIKLGLTKSFRVPKLISARQVQHVPDFGSMDFLPDGNIESWPKQPAEPAKEPVRSWSLNDIPQYDSFILCRNNAPLVKLAFALIKARRPVKILGREIGATLANIILRITNKQSVPIAELYPKLEEWKAREIAKAGDSDSKRDAVHDRYDAIIVLLDAGNCADSLAAAQFIRDLFSDKADNQLTLATGHKAKGLERKWVLHLDPWRVPSKQALKAQDYGNTAPLMQELNLKYVIETRAQETLVGANLEDCQEIDHER